jgi:hypothetical protein
MTDPWHHGKTGFADYIYPTSQTGIGPSNPLQGPVDRHVEDQADDDQTQTGS